MGERDLDPLCPTDHGALIARPSYTCTSSAANLRVPRFQFDVCEAAPAKEVVADRRRRRLLTSSVLFGDVRSIRSILEIGHGRETAGRVAVRRPLG
jgi:hypothetical protein